MTRDEAVERAFLRALQMTPAERSELLSRLEAEVRREVESLLAARDRRGLLDTLIEQATNPEAGEVDAAILERLHRGLADRYRVDRVLGRGGMAVVWLAHDLRHGRPVALKVMRPSPLHRGASPEFLREIATVAQLAHPHILPLYDSGEVDGLLFYVMPYLAGDSLRDRLRSEGGLPPAEAVRIAREVADALDFAHRHDVVHRDIKPENIMFQDGHALVADFGIARPATATVTGEGGLIRGTPAYMSPEQRNPDAPVDGRSDVYSLALVLLEMFTGWVPTGGADPARHARDLEAAGEQDVAPAILDAVRRALAPAPDDRYPSAADFRQALIPPTPPIGVPAGATPHPRAWILAGIGLAVLLALGVLVLRPTAPAGGEVRTLAILPIAAPAADPELTDLGRDLMVTLSAALDGVGEIRVADPLAVLAQAPADGRMTLEQGLTVARRLEAATVLHGTVVRTPPTVRVDLALVTADSARVVARASASAHPADLTALTDTLAWTLLRGMWPDRDAPTIEFAAITTRSLPALKAFLAGENAMVRGRWEAASDAYGLAVGTDSAFWLARWRYAFARWWYLEEVDQALLQPLYAHREALPERDRLVLESWWTDTIPVALARARLATERYPGYWPAWMQYGDWLFHAGPVYGHEPGDAVVALHRVVALNPNFLPAWEHLYWGTIRDQPQVARRALDAMTTLGFAAASTQEFGYDVARLYRLELRFAETGAVDATLADSVAADLMHRARGRTGGGLTLLPLQTDLSGRVLAMEPEAALGEVHERVLADAMAARGAWDSALAVASLGAGRPVGSDALAAYRLAVVGAWVGAVAPERAVRYRAVPARALERPGAGEMRWAELAWLDGLLAAARGRANDVAVARAAIRRAGASTSPLLDRSLAGLELGLAGDAARAGAALAALTRDQPDVLAPGYAEHPYLMAVSRLAAAQWLATAGDTAGARRQLRWFQAGAALDGYRPARRVLGSLAALERARLAVRQNDADRARREYALFLRLCDRPDPGLRTRHDLASATLLALGGGLPDSTGRR